MAGRSSAALAVLCALGTLAPAGSGEAGSGPDAQAAFSPQEQARLLRGQLVERRTLRQHGKLRLMGGASWQLIDSPPEVVWTALLDTEHYHRFLPQVVEARLIRERAGTRTVFVRHGGLASASYYVAIRVESPLRDMSFRVADEGRDGVRAAWGFYNVRPHGQRQTLLAFGIMADIGDGLLTALVRPRVHEWMMRVPWMVKRFVEGSGRYIYKQRPAPTALATQSTR